MQPQLDPLQSLPPQKSADPQICPLGRSLLELSEASDLHILNGRTPDDADGHFTCYTASGSSVVDYSLASSTLLHPMPSLAVGEKCAESDHCPLNLKLTLQAASNTETLPKAEPSLKANSVAVEKMRYDSSKIGTCRSILQSLLYPVFIAPQSQCCLASALQCCIAQAALLSFGRPRGKPLHKTNNKWYDEECKIARAALSNIRPETHEHVAKSKYYKQLLRRKRRAWQRKAQGDLCELAARNPTSLWQHYNERQSHKCNITRQHWKDSFEALYKAPEASPAATSTQDPVNPLQSPNPAPIPDSLPDASVPDLLNADTTQEEVEAALKWLKRTKAAGVDGIRDEYILDACEVLLGPLVQTFNQMLNKGVPPAWCTGWIHPIFKSGDPDDAWNSEASQW